MKTLRERFEEDYAPVKVPAAGKGGFKIRYVYYGPWYVWDLEEKKLKKKKQLLAAVSGAGLAVYLLAGLQPSGANSFAGVEAAGILGLCAHVFELSGLFSFLLARYRTSRMTFNQVNGGLLSAPLLRCLFLGAAAWETVVYMSRNTYDRLTFLVAMGYLACAGGAFFIFYQYKKIPVRTEKNNQLYDL